MNISGFYSLSSKWVSKTFQAHPVYPPAALKKFNELSNGDYYGIDFPVVFKQAYGNRLEDVLDTGTVSLYLISEKFRTLLTEAGITGWQTFDVKVLDKKGNEVPGYYGLSITGRCGKVDLTAGEIIEKQVIPAGPLWQYRKGLHVDMDKWDGSDLSRPEGMFFLIATPKAADMIRKNKITNVRLQKLEDIEMAV